MGKDSPGLERRAVPKFGGSSSHPQLPSIKAPGQQLINRLQSGH